MTIQASIVKTALTSSSGYSSQLITYHLKEKLKAAGWVVKGSSDGTSWNWSGVDLITGPVVFTHTASINRWIVLESPHANPSDRVQLIFSNRSEQYLMNAGYCDAADMNATSTALPTGSYAMASYGGGNHPYEVKIHFSCDDANNYEFALIATREGYNLTGYMFMVLHKTVLGNPQGASKYVLHTTGAFDSSVVGVSNESDEQWNSLGNAYKIKGYTNGVSGNTGGNAHFWTRCVDSTGAQYYCGAASYAVINASGNEVHANVTVGGIGENSEFVSLPMMYFTRDVNPRYIGMGSDFLRFTSRPLSNLDTLSGPAGPHSRICLKGLNFAWDGTTNTLP